MCTSGLSPTNIEDQYVTEMFWVAGNVWFTDTENNKQLIWILYRTVVCP